MRHRATTRYNTGKHRGKAIPRREIARRIAQSFGYNHSNSSITTVDQINKDKGEAVLSL